MHTIERISMRAGAAALVLAFAVTGCGQSAKSATPSALAQSPSDYDGQSVSVGGTAKSPAVRKTKRGHLLTFQLCDSACINVVEFGDAATVDDGATVSLTGTFHETFGRMRRMNNVLVVGGRPGGYGGGGGGTTGGSGGSADNAAAQASPSPDASASP
jgi:cytochrome c-type biogenesis protein CcmE